jgi:quercetin dioxygenase-like cupin family protein
MPFFKTSELAEKPMLPGFTARMVHAGAMTISFWEVKAGSSLPDHSHPHEQITTILEGTFTMTVGGETRTLGPGQGAVIPPHVPHSASSQTDCRIVDVFSPVREDYR